MIDSFLNLILIGGIPLIFLLVFLEGNPFVGSFIPGQAIVIFVGFLEATSNFVNLFLLLLVIFSGAFLGDIFGYYLGKKLGLNGIEKFGLKKESRVFRSSSRFFKKFGPWSIILGREFNLTRAFIPFLAGVFDMKKSTFLIFSLISNLIWAGISIYLGYYFGIIIIDKIEFLMIFILFLLIYIGFIFIIYNSFKSFYMKNYLLYRDYALSNIIVISISSILLVLFLYIGKWGYIHTINNSISFLFFDFLYYFIFLLSPSFLLFLIWILFMYLVHKKSFKWIIILIWSSIITLLLSSIFFIIIKKWFNIELYISIILFVQIIFYSFLFFKIFLRSKKNKFIINSILILILILIILIKFSQTENIYLIIISFLISLIITEIIILLSHYKILSELISKYMN